MTDSDFKLENGRKNNKTEKVGSFIAKVILLRLLESFQHVISLQAEQFVGVYVWAIISVCLETSVTLQAQSLTN